MGDDIRNILHNEMAQAAIVVFVVIALWWLAVQPFSPNEFVNQKNYWSASYEVLSVMGAIFGTVIARDWGGHKSVMGRAMLAFSAGLFLQTFGQIVYNYYTLFRGIEAPYPSLGDVGYFGSIFAYLYGALLFARAAGVHVSLRSYRSKLIGVLLPLFMLCASYFMFLSNYTFDWSQPLKIGLDFGYPLGQACYVSVAILALVLTRNVLGGLMRGPVIAVLVALIVQYFCDSNFLYQANQGWWYAGSWGDFMYAASYLSMTLALVYVGMRFRQIKDGSV
jgi:hypothetical protein